MTNTKFFKYSAYAAASLALAFSVVSFATSGSQVSAASSARCVSKTYRQTTKKNTCVYNMQRLLQRGDATNLDTDGYFGPKTEQAVRNFQDDKDIKIDGIVGPETWRELCTDDRVLNPGNSRRNIQTLRIATDIGCDRYWNE